MGKKTHSKRVETFTNELARIIRANDRPVAQGHTTTGSAMLFTVFDGLAINIVITASRNQKEHIDHG